MVTDGLNPLAPVFRLEERLRGSERIGFFVRLRSDGKLTADLEGNVELRPSGEAMIELHGELSSVPTKLVSTEDGRQLIVESEGRDLTIEVPEAFRGLVAIGWIRMGLLDTVVRFLGGNLPTETESMRAYHLAAIAQIDAEPSRPDLMDCTGYAFSVHRDRGFEIALATLWIERATGLPRERAQSMRLIHADFTEQYRGFDD